MFDIITIGKLFGQRYGLSKNLCYKDYGSTKHEDVEEYIGFRYKLATYTFEDALLKFKSK